MPGMTKTKLSEMTPGDIVTIWEDPNLDEVHASSHPFEDAALNDAAGAVLSGAKCVLVVKVHRVVRRGVRVEE